MSHDIRMPVLASTKQAAESHKAHSAQDRSHHAAYKYEEPVIDRHVSPNAAILVARIDDAEALLCGSPVRFSMDGVLIEGLLPVFMAFDLNSVRSGQAPSFRPVLGTA